MQSGGDDEYPGSGSARERRRRRFRIPLSYIILTGVVLIVAFFAASVWLNWSILESMYSLKAKVDWFGISFYGGLTFLTAGLLAMLFVNPFPRRSDLFEAFNALLGLQYRQNPYLGRYGSGGSEGTRRRIRPVYFRPSLVLWGFWQALKWVVLFIIFSGSNGFPLFTNLTIIMDMEVKGYGSWALVPRVMSLPLYPATGQEIISLVPTMEIQYQILAYFITVFLMVVAIRFFLKFIRDAVIRAGDKWIRNIFVTLSTIGLMVLLNVPYWPMDITIPFQFGAVVIIFAGFLVGALYFQFRSSREIVPLRERRRVGILAITVILVVILLVNLSVYSYYLLNWNNNWIAYEWHPLTQKQLIVSRWTAGIQNINNSSIPNVPSGNASKTLSLIRQWSSNATLTQSKNRIGVNYYQLVSQPEIVYVYDHEYWVTPTTFNYPDPNDWVAVHLIYTHTSKIIVMDSHSGQFVNVTQAFRLSSQPLIYYGEDVPGAAGFSNDVFVHVKGAASEIEGAVYSGQSDYNLCGAQRSLWFLQQAQIGFALSPPQDCIPMLHDRNVFDRVGNILIYGLLEDTSTYLVTDSAAGGDNLYYAIQVYVDYPLHTSFSMIPSGPEPGPLPYLRLFGVVLVNVRDGSMQGYTLAGDDGFLASFYKQYYRSWTAPPAWLMAQLRYPEQLLGNQNYLGQLDADFVLHVDDPSTFRAGSNFFERPTNTEVLYIPFVIGNNVSFTAVQLVEFASSRGGNLAGLYVTYGGDRLGKMYLYAANASGTNPTALLGPTAALSKFANDQTTKQQLTLTGANPGNILLYPVNGHLYYFIPAYIFQSGGSSNLAATNPFIDVVDAQNPTAPVRFINTSSVLDQNYGFQNVITVTNSSQREAYVNRLFRAQGITISNATITNVNIFENLGIANYTSDAQNASATQFVNSFIHSYAKNVSVTRGHLAFNSVFEWSPSSGMIYYGFVVADQGVTKLYEISVAVGS